MARETSIEWADSSLNLMMGCAGCELWNSRIRACYAGALHDRYAGRRGWPKSFEEPALFLDRLPAALRWPDMTGMARPEKPWLDGRRRLVFLNDMGDTFTKGLPEDWLAPLLPQLAAAPHAWIVLTKRPEAMARFAVVHEVPTNVWMLASVTSGTQRDRIECMRRLKRLLPCHTIGLSVEPMIDRIDPEGMEELDWIIVGGESNQGTHSARPLRLEWVRELMDACVPTRFFLKQLGRHPFGLDMREIQLDDGHGGDWDHWPEWARVRQVPGP